MDNKYDPENLILSSFVVYVESPCECEHQECSDPATVTLQVSDLRATTCELHFLQLLSLTLESHRNSLTP